MDDLLQTAESPAPSPARGRGFASRRGGRGGIAKRAARKAIAARRGTGRGKGRGRNKTYDDARTQAAYERQKDLRDLYYEVASAAKAGLEELAERSIRDLIENPGAHQEVAEFAVLQQQLDDQLKATIAAAEAEYETKQAVLRNSYELDTDFTNSEYHNGFADITDDFYAGALNRTSILTELRNEGAPADTPDFRYEYVEEDDEVAQQQGPFVQYRRGVEIPYPSLLADKKTAIKSQTRKPRAISRRKAEEQPDGQPDFKRVNGATSAGPRAGEARDEADTLKLEPGEDASTPRPRHIGGLLAAEEDQDAEAESNAPSPTPLDDGQSPASDQKAAAAAAKKDLPDLPVGATEPDAWGVRTLYKRGPKANNRVILPPLFDFDDDEIGFRDSTNDSTRKATRTTRGKFVNKPNSRNFHHDQMLLNYNVLDYEDDALDPELVKKYNLHPKYGFFLPESVNESEPSSELVDGTRPVVVVTPNGSTLHASRTVKAKIMDEGIATDTRKAKVNTMLDAYLQSEEITRDDIKTDEIREREEQLLERMQTAEEMEESDDQEEYFETIEDTRMAKDNTAQLLQAAEQLNAEQQALRTPTQRASRPYDAIRDIFMSSEPPPPPPQEADTNALFLLANASEQFSHAPPPYLPHTSFPSAPPPMRGHERTFSGEPVLIDPRISGPQPLPHSASQNAFLQTALNPTPSFAPIAPAPPHSVEVQAQTPIGRVPFTNSSSTKSSPVLPPLRPSRRDKQVPIEPAAPAQPPAMQTTNPAPQQDFGSPRGMLVTPTGNYYPPAPSRAFHSSYSAPEQPPTVPMPLQQSPRMGHLLISSQAPPPPQSHATAPHLSPLQSVSGYPVVSPPMPGQAQIAPMPVSMAPAPPVPSAGPSPTGPPLLMAASPPGGTPPRHRNSISSNGPNSSNNPASSKYRKIAAAPIPHNRPLYANGGSELRVAQYDHKEAIKDYRADAPPPNRGQISIRGWSVNNVNKSRNRNKKEGSASAEDKDSPK